MIRMAMYGELAKYKEILGSLVVGHQVEGLAVRGGGFGVRAWSDNNKIEKAPVISCLYRDIPSTAMYHDGSIAPFDFPGSGSATSDVLSARPSLDQSDGWPVDFSNPLFMTNPITMNHHVGSPSTLFENHNEPLRRPRKKELFADSEESMPPRSPVAGPSTRPFYLEHQPSDTYPTYGLETMTGLKRKRADSFEPIQSWLQNPNPPDMIDLVDDDSPGPSYSNHSLSNLLSIIPNIFANLISLLSR